MAQCTVIVQQQQQSSLGLDNLAKAAASVEEGEIVEDVAGQSQGCSQEEEERRTIAAVVAALEPKISILQKSLAFAPQQQQQQASTIRGKTPPPPCRYGKKGYPYGRGSKAHPMGKKYVALSASDTESYSSSESEDDADDRKQQPSVRAVLRGPPKDVLLRQQQQNKKRPPIVGSTTTAKSTKTKSPAPAAKRPKQHKQPKGKPAPHLRRLRVADIKKKPSEAQKKRMATGPAEGQPAAKRSKSKKAVAVEPDAMRDSDIKSLETHPVVMYLRRHTPVKPCGRCAECRRPPCGKCGSCKKNMHLTERSRARERCTANGCSKLTEEELDRYRRAYNSAYTVDVLERELRNIRTEFMTIQERSSPSTDASAVKKMQELQQRQTNLIARLQALSDEDPVLIQQTPEGYECFLLSIQTLETERDRIARFVERRACRDPENIMSSRRQLRGFYGRQICYMTRLFANDMVARPYVSKLIEIADEHERLINSLPQTEA